MWKRTEKCGNGQKNVETGRKVEELGNKYLENGRNNEEMGRKNEKIEQKYEELGRNYLETGKNNVETFRKDEETDRKNEESGRKFLKWAEIMWKRVKSLFSVRFLFDSLPFGPIPFWPEYRLVSMAPTYHISAKVNMMHCWLLEEVDLLVHSYVSLSPSDLL